MDAAFVLESCQPGFSEKGSVKYSREVDIMNFFQDFLQNIEDCGMFHLVLLLFFSAVNGDDRAIIFLPFSFVFTFN